MKKTVNILGSCVSRDLFPSDTEYEIGQYVSFSSPMSMYQPAGKRVMTMDEIEDFVKTSKFALRCLMLDHNKKTFDYLSEKNSDYLILDIADVRMNLAKYADGFTTHANSILLNAERFTKRFGAYQKLTALDFSEQEWYDCIDWFCEQILKLYTPQQIILNEFYMAADFRSKDHRIKTFTEKYRISSKNALLKKMYDRCKAHFAGCHVISPPEHLLADSYQKWGLHPMHFHKYYYDYAYEAVQLIMEQVPEETVQLEALRRLYSERFAHLRTRLEQNNVQKQLKEAEYSKKKLAKYGEHFCELVENYAQHQEQAAAFCRTHGIRSVACWGDFLTTRVLLTFLEQAGVKLDYIIGAWTHHKEVPLYATNLDQYPKTDAIIICDVMASDNLMEKIAAKSSCNVYSIYDILPMQKAK